jgi:hypothetical protein
MERPALATFFRSISSPIMNSRKIKPSSEIAEIDSADLIKPNPIGPSAKPPAR